MGVAGAVVGSAVIGGVAANSAANKAASGARRAARTQAEAGREAIAGQEAAAERAQGFFEPFADASQQGIEGSSFLTDPNERFEFLQNNPLFDLALKNANQQTRQQASAGRRLSFGDTLQQLSNNVLLSSAPLLATQDQNVSNMLQFGGDIATSQANIETGQAARIGGLTTDIGAAQAAGLVGSANAQAAGTQAIGQAFQTGIMGASGGFGGGGVPINQSIANNPNTLGTITPQR
jgi:hypothetical protein